MCLNSELIRPDIIAIKDNKIYAVEIEMKPWHDYDKYKNLKFFDKVIWVKNEKGKKLKDVTEVFKIE